MNTEPQVAPDVATQNPASEPANQPEVATPETQAEDTQPQSAETEESRAEKAAKALERRLGKRTADLYRERAERERLERELSQLRQPEAREEAPDPVVIAKQLVEREKLVTTVQTVLKDGKKLENFDQACNEVAEVIPFYDGQGAPTQFLRVVLEADAPAVLLHHLGQNPELVEELADLSPTQQARRLDRLERELSAKPKTSTAPKPLTPVKPSASQSGPRDEDDVDTWMAKERARMAARGI